MTQIHALEGSGAEFQACVVAGGAARVGARRLHAIDAVTVVGGKLYLEGPAVAGPGAVCAGEYFGAISSAYGRLSVQGETGNDPCRYRRPLSLLRPAGRQGDPLRRGRGRRSIGLVGRRHGRPNGRMA